MKAIILSAGQGKRLLPLTEAWPKCLLKLDDKTTILSWQLQALENAGVTDTLVVTGFEADKVEQEIRLFHTSVSNGSMKITTLMNPFYKVADNISSIWLARTYMSDDFIVLNGDTVFQTDVAKRLIHDAKHPVTLTVSFKDKYDDDDMKVALEDKTNRLLRVGKTLSPKIVNGESIGMMLFKNEGIQLFKDTLDQKISEEGGVHKWYLSVLDHMAAMIHIGTIEASQDEWREVDFPVDYKNACDTVAKWQSENTHAPITQKTGF